MYIYIYIERETFTASSAGAELQDGITRSGDHLDLGESDRLCGRNGERIWASPLPEEIRDTPREDIRREEDWSKEV